MPDPTLIWPKLAGAREHTLMRDALRAHFQELRECSHEHFLSIYEYLHRCPQRFYSGDAYTELLAWLEASFRDHPDSLLVYFSKHHQDLSRSLQFLGEINRQDWHDKPFPREDYEKMRLIEIHIHPAYLRLVEGVLAEMLRPVARSLRMLRNVGTEGLDVFNIMEELRSSQLASLADLYDHIMRNMTIRFTHHDLCCRINAC